MTCNNWEKGTLRFSNTKAYRDFKRRVVERFMEQVKKDLVLANAALAAVKAAKPKGARGFAWQRALLEKMHETPFELKALSPWRVARFMAIDSVREPGAVVERDVPRSTPRQLTAKEAGSYSMKSTQLQSIEGGCEVDFNDTERSVTWRVPENNHAVERARDSFLGVLLFEELKRADWGRSGGGCLVGNDEYRREASHAGGGANYVTEVFGPAGRKAQDDAANPLQAIVKAHRSSASLRRAW